MGKMPECQCLFRGPSICAIGRFVKGGNSALRSTIIGQSTSEARKMLLLALNKFHAAPVEIGENGICLEPIFSYNAQSEGAYTPRDTTRMKLKKSAGLTLAKGQIWKLQDSHIEILEMGKRLASYKHFRTLDNRRAPTQLANIASVQEMLQLHKAVLLDTKAGSAAIKKITKKRA
jgi:hypothetical protein